MIENIICFAHSYTLTDANHIIVLLILVVIVLIVMGCYSIRYNRIISQRNEQLRRILTALDDYRAIVGDGGSAARRTGGDIEVQVEEDKGGPVG